LYKTKIRNRIEITDRGVHFEMTRFMPEVEIPKEILISFGEA
jgi:hypothetical protein